MMPFNERLVGVNVERVLITLKVRVSFYITIASKNSDKARKSRWVLRLTECRGAT